jgi:hypothetical protein
VSVLAGYLPAGFGLVDPWLGNLLSLALLFALLRAFGRRAADNLH